MDVRAPLSALTLIFLLYLSTSKMIPVSPLVLIFGAFALLILNRIYYELSVGAARRKMIKEHGCLPANKLPHKDPIFGLDMIMENARNFKQGKFLEAGRERALKYGYTVQFNLLGMTGEVTSNRFSGIGLIQCSLFYK